MKNVIALRSRTREQVSNPLDWRASLPVLSGPRVALREIQISDAASLAAMVCTEEVTRFTSAPPDTREGLDRFIVRAQRDRAAGAAVCFAVVPHGLRDAIGIIQLRQGQGGFEVAEWGFTIGSPFWGTGLFIEAARLALGFAFETLGVQRLEARVAVANGRGNGVLAKLGGSREGILRSALRSADRVHDQVIWAILAEEWNGGRARGASWIH